LPEPSGWGNSSRSTRSIANSLPHEIRIACDTDTFELLTLAKARLIPHLRTEPSNRVVLRVLAKLFFKYDSQNRVGTMLTRMRIEEGPERAMSYVQMGDTRAHAHGPEHSPATCIQPPAA
jgi:hypothetical protein